jgi:uncharacterized repeat protein (TIGR01451 family)
MNRLFNILFILIIIQGLASSTEYESHLSVKGDGQVYSNTNLNLAKDHLNAAGEQTYDRLYINRPERSTFISNFNLSKSSANRPYIYSIASSNPEGQYQIESEIAAHSSSYSMSGMFPDGMINSIGLASQSTMRATNWIEITDKGTTSKFRVATEGYLKEAIAQRDSENRPKFMEETMAKGDITFASGLKTNATFRPESEAQNLLTSLESVVMYGETARRDVLVPKAEITAGETKYAIVEGTTGSIELENSNVTLGTKPSITSSNGIDRKLETAKENGVSEYTDIGNFRVIQPRQDAQAILVDITSNPVNGTYGTEANISITLSNWATWGYNAPDIAQTYVSTRLPAGMKFLDSSTGMYRNGYINWSNIGSIEAHDSKTVSYRAKVNEYVSEPIKSMVRVYATGITSNDTVLRGDETIYFALEPVAPNSEHESDKINAHEGGIDIFRPNEIPANVVNTEASESDQGSTVLSNESDVLLTVKSVSGPEIAVEKKANRVVITGVDNSITYTIKIRNTGQTNLTEISVEDDLPQGAVFDDASALLPDINMNGHLKWNNIGPIKVNESEFLIYSVKASGKYKDGEKLRNNVSVTARDEFGQIAPKKSSSSIVTYSTVAEMTPEGDFAIVQSKVEEPELVKREPLIRDTVHLGKDLVIDRHAYVGWKEFRKPHYFITNATEKRKYDERLNRSHKPVQSVGWRDNST